ncbi:MAG: aminopeptidase P N-terminal domain-containing protein [Desulfobacterales bacterium]|nr:aminopeptidase P N-terminal domain-containing protein [Desulfobacterales bacterium]MDJ0885348.1 aminopeptidase P N-terminal domain-containing protein [Desulfobacterales bacterium]
MFPREIYRSRRRRLTQALSSGLIVVFGHQASPINFQDNAYPFRQDSSFLYYGGLAVPDLVMLLDCDAGQSYLYGREASPHEALWTGPAPALAELAEAVAFDHHGGLPDLAQCLQSSQRQQRAIHYLPPYRADQILLMSELLAVPADQVVRTASPDLIRAVVAQRAVKSSEEVAEIELALGIARSMYQAATDGRLENQTPLEIAGRMAAVVAAHDSRFSFAPIVTPRGEILHGGVPAEPLGSDDLLLMDFGAESPGGYASDITRTLPVSGRFDTRQRELYEIVLLAQKAAIAAIAPEKRFLDIHLLAAEIICRGLKELGLMKGTCAEAVAAGAHALFFPTGLGHMLGLDVHDMESLGEDLVGYDDQIRRSDQFGLAALRLGRQLKPGFVVTVEPGIYFNRGLIEEWRHGRRAEAFIHYDKLAAYYGFGGIRIEDDILVTETGARVLGPTIPKSIATVEASLQ